MLPPYIVPARRAKACSYCQRYQVGGRSINSWVGGESDIDDGSLPGFAGAIHAPTLSFNKHVAQVKTEAARGQ